MGREGRPSKAISRVFWLKLKEPANLLSAGFYFVFKVPMININKGQSVIEYVLLVAVTVLAIIAIGYLGGNSFNEHFNTASGGYFSSGGIKPASK